MADNFAADYVDVAERLRLAREIYPELTLTFEWSMLELNGQTILTGKAKCYRSPEDTCPGEGTAWEFVPGRTPYTRGSELMNLETSCWGRALLASVPVSSRKIASKEEVLAAREMEQPKEYATHMGEQPASEAQVKKIKAIMLKAGHKGDLEAAATVALGHEIVFDKLTKAQAIWCIEQLEKMEA